MTKVLLFMDMESPWGWGVKVKHPGMENLGGWDQPRKTKLHGGYGHFLEPLVECSKCFFVIRFNSTGKSERISSSKLQINN